jgi:hypothetical protein
MDSWESRKFLNGSKRTRDFKGVLRCTVSGESGMLNLPLFIGIDLITKTHTNVSL